MKKMCTSETFCECMKALRQKPMTIKQMAEEAGIKDDTAARWVKKLSAHGMLEQRGHAAPTSGNPPKQFAVTGEWGGQA